MGGAKLPDEPDPNELLEESEDDLGLVALCDILAGLDDEEFAEMAEDILGVDDPSEDVVSTIHDEAAGRCDRIFERREHFAAVAFAARCCTPEKFIVVCRDALAIHSEESDGFRLLILRCLQDNSELLAMLTKAIPGVL